VFAPTRSIEGPYVPPRPAQRPARQSPVPRRQVNQRPATRPVAAPQRVVQQVIQAAQRRPKKQKAPAAQATPLSAPLPPLPAAPEVPQASTPRKPTGADAAALSRWLTPRTLRSQFILTEILQPPLALREEK